MYDDDETFVGRVASFLRAGVDAGPTIAVYNRRHRALLREELGADAERVAFADSDDFYVRPIDALASYAATLRRLVAAGSESVRVTAELPLGPTRGGWSDWISYEAILNLALSDWPVHILCAWDTNAVSDAVIDAIWQTHPHVDAVGVGPQYHEPRDIVAAFTSVPARNLPLPTLAATRDPTAFREELAAALAEASAPQAKVVDMLVAATEIFKNALEHGGGPSALRAGLVDGWFVCEIRDRGPGLDDPLAGYLPPGPGRPERAGLWLARQLVSRLELLPAQPGLAVRLWL